MEAITIGERWIGPDRPVFVIAEAGVNHNGDPQIAHRLVDAAADAGADAVKFQTFRPELLASATAPTAAYQSAAGGVATQRDLLHALVLPQRTWSDLAAHASERAIAFLSTPFDEASADTIVELGVKALKIPSGELTNLPFLRLLAKYGLPLIVSTGMATLREVVAALDAVSGVPACLMHCVSSYPAPVEQANLRAIATMARTFSIPVGWSDHTTGELTALVAIGLGASILEKHVTLDRSMAGPDHLGSMDPAELRNYISAVRRAQKALGDGSKQPQFAELENRRLVRRSLHAARDLDAGHRLTRDDVVALRPEGGLPPDADVTGRSLRRAAIAGEALTADMLEVDTR